jgi:hypothetical protein
MRTEIQLRIVGDDNNVISEGEILHFDKGDDRLEVIGLSFNEAKAALVGIQGGVVTAQAAGFLARHWFGARMPRLPRRMMSDRRRAPS